MGLFGNSKSNYQMGYELGRSMGLAQSPQVYGISQPEEAALARTEVRKEWLEWYNRKLEAEAAGKPFDEPPPGED